MQLRLQDAEVFTQNKSAYLMSIDIHNVIFL